MNEKASIQDIENLMDKESDSTISIAPDGTIISEKNKQPLTFKKPMGYDY
jgi:hypothetical protein